jgi:hypothetical protein
MEMTGHLQDLAALLSEKEASLEENTESYHQSNLIDVINPLRLNI